LEEASPDGVVLGDRDPSPSRHFREPLLVGSILGEVVVVDLDRFPGLPQRLGHDHGAEAAVEEQGRRFGHG
jgi:hypothetical protein